jgi:hypothetical protein
MDDWWQAQELIEREQYEIEAGLLRANPAYIEWLE